MRASTSWRITKPLRRLGALRRSRRRRGPHRCGALQRTATLASLARRRVRPGRGAPIGPAPGDGFGGPALSWSLTHRSARRDSFDRGSAALEVSCRHTCPQPSHRYRRIVTSRSVGRQPSGSCASPRATVSRGAPWQPQRRHHPSGSTTRHARTARSGSSRCPVTSRPELVQPGERGQVGVREDGRGSVRHVGVFLVGSVGTPILGRPRPINGPTRRPALHPAL